MKTYIYNKVVTAVFLSFCLLTFSPFNAEAKKPKKLIILHTNDTHSTIHPVNAQLPDTMKAGRRSARSILTCYTSTAVTSVRGLPTLPCSRVTWRLG